MGSRLHLIAAFSISAEGILAGQRNLVPKPAIAFPYDNCRNAQNHCQGGKSADQSVNCKKYNSHDKILLMPGI